MDFVNSLSSAHLSPTCFHRRSYSRKIDLGFVDVSIVLAMNRHPNNCSYSIVLNGIVFEIESEFVYMLLLEILMAEDGNLQPIPIHLHYLVDLYRSGRWAFHLAKLFSLVVGLRLGTLVVALSFDLRVEH